MSLVYHRPADSPVDRSARTRGPLDCAPARFARGVRGPRRGVLLTCDGAEPAVSQRLGPGAAMYSAMFDSPIGRLTWLHDGAGAVFALSLTGAEAAELAPAAKATDALISHEDVQLSEDLARYFAGEPVRWRSRPEPLTGTPFQRRVWNALSRVPHGRVLSYAELAGLADRPNAVRAVGAACGANPIPLIVPCHRVIRADGGLGGFGPGPAMKSHLLALEGVSLKGSSRQIRTSRS